MSIKSDKWIRHMAGTTGMIEPFELRVWPSGVMTMPLGIVISFSLLGWDRLARDTFFGDKVSFTQTLSPVPQRAA